MYHISELKDLDPDVILNPKSIYFPSDNLNHLPLRAIEHVALRVSARGCRRSLMDALCNVGVYEIDGPCHNCVIRSDSVCDACDYYININWSAVINERYDYFTRHPRGMTIYAATEARIQTLRDEDGVW